MDEIPLEGLTAKELIIAEKINEIVKLINKFMPSVNIMNVSTALGVDIVPSSVDHGHDGTCCQDDKEGLLSDDEMKKLKGECLHDESKD